MRAPCPVFLPQGELSHRYCRSRQVDCHAHLSWVVAIARVVRTAEMRPQQTAEREIPSGLRHHVIVLPIVELHLSIPSGCIPHWIIEMRSIEVKIGHLAPASLCTSHRSFAYSGKSQCATLVVQRRKITVIHMIVTYPQEIRPLHHTRKGGAFGRGCNLL